MSSQRPRIKLSPTLIEVILEYSGWGILALLWLVVVWYYPILKEVIPIHFDASGNPDGFGDKKYIFLMPIVGTVLYLGISILSRYPHLLNYPTEIDNENAFRHYKTGSLFLKWLNWAIATIFLVLDVLSIRVALGKAETLGIWFLPIASVLIFIPLLFFILKLIK